MMVGILFIKYRSEIILTNFFTEADISNLIAYAFGILVEVPVPFPLEKPEVCKYPESGLSCPLKKDELAEYKTTFSIDKKTPAVIF